MSSAFRLLGLIYFSMVSWSWAVDLSTVTHAGKRFIICCLDLKTETLQLLLHDDVGQPLRSFERAQQWLGEKQQKLVFGRTAACIMAICRLSGYAFGKGASLRR